MAMPRHAQHPPSPPSLVGHVIAATAVAPRPGHRHVLTAYPRPEDLPAQPRAGWVPAPGFIELLAGTLWARSGTHPETFDVVVRTSDDDDAATQRLHTARVTLADLLGARGLHAHPERVACYAADADHTVSALPAEHPAVAYGIHADRLRRWVNELCTDGGSDTGKRPLLHRHDGQWEIRIPLDSNGFRTDDSPRADPGTVADLLRLRLSGMCWQIDDEPDTADAAPPRLWQALEIAPRALTANPVRGPEPALPWERA